MGSRVAKKYRTIVVALTASVCLVLFLVGLILGLSLSTFVLAVVGPALPALFWGVKEARKQNATISRVEELKTMIERGWTEAMDKRQSPEELTKYSRTIQDEIFRYRSTNPPVIEWLYRRHKNDQEEDMHAAVDAKVKEALAKA